MLPPPALAGEPVWNWSGFHVGGHVGAFTGATTFSDDSGPSLFGGSVATPGFAIGAQVGYDWMLSPRWLLGVEVGASYLSGDGSNTCAQPTVTFVGSNCKAAPREIATLTGRLGFAAGAAGRTLLYGKGGLAYMRSEVSLNPNNAFGNLVGSPISGDPLEQGAPTVRAPQLFGWTVGLGAEQVLDRNWSLALDYNYLRFGGGLPTPPSVDVQPGGQVTSMPPGWAALTQDLHVVKLGLNYRFGGAARQGERTPETAFEDVPRAPWHAGGWLIEAGVRYWYSTGTYRGANGNDNVLVSRLTYDEMQGHSGEVYARVDMPGNFFVKGLAGGGAITSGQMDDEDWGLSGAGEPTIAYEYARSSVTGSFTYLTLDAGYTLLRGPDHRLGLFLGYNRQQFTLSAFGCTQMVQPQSVCSPPMAPNVNAISEIDTWHALRTGVAAELQLTDRLRIGGDFAWLPYAYVDALDIHHQREPVVFFPVQGSGRGVQAELVATYQASERWSFGLGARYWAMWSNNAQLRAQTSSDFNLSTERYGVFLQAGYRFNPG